MKPVITIDQGNTRTKVSVVNDGQILARHISDFTPLELIETWRSNYDSCGIIYSSVSRLDVRTVESLRLISDGNLLVLTHSTPLPVNIDYYNPSTLGTDRIVGAVGALKRLGPECGALIVDAGTCMTLDILDENSTFRGGNISPGLSMRLRAMHEYTGRLPLASIEGETPRFGYDTETALRSGTVFGILDEIAGTAVAAADCYGIRDIILTGGDMKTLHSHLNGSRRPSAPNLAQFRIIPDPDLITIGLEQIYRYNENL